MLQAVLLVASRSPLTLMLWGSRPPSLLLVGRDMAAAAACREGLAPQLGVVKISTCLHKASCCSSVLYAVCILHGLERNQAFGVAH